MKKLLVGTAAAGIVLLIASRTNSGDMLDNWGDAYARPISTESFGPVIKPVTNEELDAQIGVKQYSENTYGGQEYGWIAEVRPGEGLWHVAQRILERQGTNKPTDDHLVDTVQKLMADNHMPATPFNDWEADGLTDVLMAVTQGQPTKLKYVIANIPWQPTPLTPFYETTHKGTTIIL